jgi:hypothetical protein
MATSVFPIASSSSGDPASQTFISTASGTYNLESPLSPGIYELTSNVLASNSSTSISFKTSGGYVFASSFYGGKGSVSIPSTVNQITVPGGIFLNIRLANYTQMAAPTSSSFTFTVGNTATFTFTAPASSTNITAYFADGTNTSFATTTSPKASINVPGAANSSPTVLLVGTDARGVLGRAATITSTNTVYIPFSGGSVLTYNSGGTNYFVNYFGASADLIVNNSGNYDIALIAGGSGGGGNYNGAFGGTGGSILAQTGRSISAGTYPVGIGGGGGTGAAGGSSTFNGLTAIGRVGTTHNQSDEGGATGSGNFTSSGIGGSGAGQAGGVGVGRNGGNGRNALGGFTFPLIPVGSSNGYFSGGASGYQSGYGPNSLGVDSYGGGGRALNNSGLSGGFIIRAAVV